MYHVVMFSGEMLTRKDTSQTDSEEISDLVPYCSKNHVNDTLFRFCF